jgi:uncharacterized protein YkwD
MSTRLHKRVKLALVPHAKNQYRPHAIRRYGMVAIIIFVFAIQALYNGMATGSVLGAEADITANGLLAATNQERAAQNEAPLVVNEKLMQAAKLKAQNMFAEQYWAHNAPDGTTPWHWFNEANYEYSEAGENLAKNFTSSTGTVAAWMASPTHRANILKADYKDVGFAVINDTLAGKPTTIVVALYGAPETVSAASVQGVATTVAPTMAGEMSPLSRFNLGLHRLTPAVMTSLVILAVAAALAMLAHQYRNKLPLQLRKSWYRHHGVYKAVSFASLALVFIFVSGGVGQI